MFDIGGELAINIARVRSDRWFIEPASPDKPWSDLTMEDTEGKYLSICGENDWGYLAAELLKPLLIKGNDLYYEISKNISKLNPEIVLVGKNDFRLLDIVHLVRDPECGISIIKNVPIIKGDFTKGIKYLGNKGTEEYLPF